MAFVSQLVIFVASAKDGTVVSTPVDALGAHLRCCGSSATDNYFLNVVEIASDIVGVKFCF